MYKISLLNEGQAKTNLIGRRLLIPLRERIEKEMEYAPAGTVFYYDMSNVEGINGSGADELIAKPIKWFRETYKTSDKYLVLMNLDEEHDHIYNINLTLKEENVAVLAKQNNQIEILGDIGDALKEILIIANERGEITAREIVELLDKKLTLASTQLTKLFEMRLLKRFEVQLEEGGRQYIYQSLFK